MLVLRDSRRLLPAALAGILLFSLHVGAVFSSQSCSANPAGATSPCAATGPASQDSAAGVDTGAGNPINVTNGNKYQRETDLAALPGELGLELVRHYNSSASRVVGQLGNGWRLSYETDLYVLGRSIQILQADGARIVFSRDAGDLCSSRNPVMSSGTNSALAPPPRSESTVALPRSSLTSPITTAAPARASARAIPSPSPRAPPVTRALRPARS